MADKGKARSNATAAPPPAAGTQQECQTTEYIRPPCYTLMPPCPKKKTPTPPPEPEPAMVACPCPPPLLPPCRCTDDVPEEKAKPAATKTDNRKGCSGNGNGKASSANTGSPQTRKASNAKSPTAVPKNAKK